MSFDLWDEVYGGGISYYDSCIVASYRELILLTSIYGTDVLEPGMTISYPIRYPEYDPVGRIGVH
jgi:hypothetical protein